MADEKAKLNKNENIDSLDFDDLEKALQDDDLQKELDEQMAELSALEEEREKIGDPKVLGEVVLNTIWEQFTNQIAVRAGEDFIKENGGLKLNLSDESHILNSEDFEKGKFPEHNFENIETYKKRFEEVRADFQTDPTMEIKMNKNMQFNEETKTYESFDKNTNAWVEKTRYNEDTKTWEDYNPKNGKWQKKLADDAREKFDTRTRDEMGNKTIHKDHVISAAEQIRDNEAAAFMDREERKDFAKSKVNIQDLDSAANQSKGDSPTEEWLDTKRKDGTSQAEYFGLDEEKLREADRKAREEYEKQKNEAKERAIKEGKASKKAEALRVGKKAARAIVMNLLSDLVKKIVQRLISWFRSTRKGLKSLLVSIKDAIVSFVVSLKKNVVNVSDTAVTVIATSILGPVVSTIKKAWMFIKQGWKSLKESIAYIRNPKNRNKPIGIMMMEVGKIVTAGFVAAGAIVLGDVIEKGLSMIPLFAVEIPMFGSLANIIGIFMGAVIAGVIGAIALNLINRAIAKKKKQELTADKIDKGNEVLATLTKINKVQGQHFQIVKSGVAETIYDRHTAAGEEMRKTLKHVEDMTVADHTEDFSSMDKSLDALLDE